MQALVLAGGGGARLRPLTYTTPKPVMPLAGRPFLSFMLDWVHSHGVDEVILSCGFMSDDVKHVLGDIYDGMRLRYVIEEEPLGTAGPVRLALDADLLDQRLLVLNGDVLTDMDLTAELAAHKRSGARVTAIPGGGHGELRRGAHPARRQRGGLPREERRPSAHQPHQRRGLRDGARGDRDRRAAGRAVSFEREVFPALVGRGSTASAATATGSTSGPPSATSRRPGTCSRAAWLDPAATRRDGLARARELRARRRPRGAAERAQASLQRGHGRARVERSVLHDRVHVGADARVVEAVLAERVRVGERARIEPGAIVGAGALIEEDAHVSAGVRVDPDTVVEARQTVT